MSKLIATVFISYPMRMSSMEETIEEFIKSNYTNVKDTGVTVGGGTVDLAYVFETPVNSKEEFKILIKPFMDKFELFKPFVQYEPEEDYKAHKEKVKKNNEKRDQLKMDLAGVYVALRDKYKNDQDTLSDIDHIFKNCIPPAWKVG